MSKTYIVSRNGGTVSKAPINDNKIPIYANESALDADLANIPDNTLVATKGGHDDVINQMKEYIRKQNVLSDWETLRDFSDVSATPTTFTADFDGFIAVRSEGYDSNYGGCSVSITRNGVQQIVGYGAGVGYVSDTLTLPYLKGDVVSAIGIYGDYKTLAGHIIVQRAEYKLRDYKGR